MAGSSQEGINYYNFDVTIQRAGAGYRAQLHSQSGENVNVTFGRPFSDMELENFLLKAGYSKRSVRRIDSLEVAAAKEFGGKLFNTVFKGDAQECLRRDLDYALNQDSRLRIRLCLTDVPELADLPWEYLYNAQANKFLALSVETPIVRYLELRERIQPLVISPPLRVLLMVSSPSDFPALDVKAEAEHLHAALASLEERGMVEIEQMAEANLPALQRRLRRGEYHIFHFIGHGGFDNQTEQGVLILEDESGRGRAVSGQDLGMLLHDHRSLRLAILNACEGARADRKDPFAGTAQSLVQQGIPAVIAMQFEITDTAAITFAREFYEAVSDNYPVDAALTEARKCLFGQGSGLEWGTPVLYLRSPNGRIFDVQRTGDSDKRAKVASLVRDANASMQSEEWEQAAARWQSVLSADPTNAEALSKLADAQQKGEWAATLEQGRKQLEAGRHAEALDRLRWVRSNAGSNFRGVDALISDAEARAAGEQRRSQIPQLFNEAQAAVAAENWPIAIQKWQAVLTLDPSNAQAQGGLQYSQKQAQLASAYVDARAKYNAGHMQEALAALLWVRNTAGSDYKGVDALIANAQRTLAAQRAAAANTNVVNTDTTTTTTITGVTDTRRVAKVEKAQGGSSPRKAVSLAIVGIVLLGVFAGVALAIVGQNGNNNGGITGPTSVPTEAVAAVLPTSTVQAAVPNPTIAANGGKAIGSGEQGSSNPTIAANGGKAIGSGEQGGSTPTEKSNADLLKEASATMKAARSYHISADVTQDNQRVLLGGDIDVANDSSQLAVSAGSSSASVIKIGTDIYVSSDGGTTYARSTANMDLSSITGMWNTFNPGDIDRAKDSLKNGSPATEMIGGVATRHITASQSDLSSLSGGGSGATGTIDMWITTDSKPIGRQMKVEGISGGKALNGTISWSNVDEPLNITAPYVP